MLEEVTLVFMLVLIFSSLRAIIVASTRMTNWRAVINLDFYVYHMVLQLIIFVYAIVSVGRTLSVKLIPETVKNQIYDGATCPSDFPQIFAMALYGYCIIMLAINWLEISLEGQPITRVEHVPTMKVFVFISLVESAFSYGESTSRPDESRDCSPSQRFITYRLIFGKMLIMTGVSFVLSAVGLLFAIKTRIHMWEHPEGWKHNVMCAYETHYFPRAVKQLSINMLLSVSTLLVVGGSFWPLLQQVMANEYCSTIVWSTLSLAALVSQFTY